MALETAVARKTVARREMGSPLLPAGQFGPGRNAFSDKTETQMGEAEIEATETEEAGTEEIQMEVVGVGSLPEKFRPPSSGSPTTEDVVAPVAGLIQKATSGLTGPERGVFLRRLREEHPELFSDRTVEGSRDLPEDLSEEKWREVLARLLKEEANRFMAAAASLSR